MAVADSDLFRRIATCAVFDLDGTLIDTAPTLRWAINGPLRDAGAPSLSIDAVRSCIGHGLDAFVVKALGLAFVGNADPDVIASVRRSFLSRVYTDVGRDAVVGAGALRVLQSIGAAGATVGVCTNKPEALARRVLRSMGLLDAIDVVVGGDTISGKQKPDPSPLLYCIEALGANARDAVLVGDSSIDIQTARAAAVPIILISGGYEPASVDCQPDALIDQFDELLLGPPFARSQLTAHG